jgi:mRNA interferase HigB
MELINRMAIARAGRKFPSSRKPLEEWAHTVRAARWSNLQEVRRTYPSADGVIVKSGGVVTVFNIGGNKFRLLSSVFYQAQRVYVIELLTHAEYSKGYWKERL